MDGGRWTEDGGCLRLGNERENNNALLVNIEYFFLLLSLSVLKTRWEQKGRKRTTDYAAHLGDGAADFGREVGMRFFWGPKEKLTCNEKSFF